MHALVNFIYCYQTIFQVETEAQRQLILPREGETVTVDGVNYKVEDTKHIFETGDDQQTINVYLKGK